MSVDEHACRNPVCLAAPSRAGRARLALVGTTSLALALAVSLSPLGQVGAGATRAGASTGETTMAALPEPQTGLSLAWALPDNAVGRQMRWLLGAVVKPPVATATLEAHFGTKFLSAVPPASFNSVLANLRLQAPVRITSLDAGTAPTGLVADIVSGTARFGLAMSVDPSGLIDGLQVSPEPPLPPAPTSWAGLDAQVRSLAPDVSFEASTVSAPGSGSSMLTSTTSTPSSGAPGTCHAVNAIAPATARPLGSTFKLYVLATVANEIRSGRLSWGQEVALTSSLRSLPSGLTQIEPAGTRFTVSELAQLMISGSDNTAADRLAALVGRTSLEAQVATTSAHASLDRPFLRTRELFVLKYADYPYYARVYLGLPVAKRTAYLSSVIDRVPLSGLDLTAAATGAPRSVGSVEWYASPADICAVYSQLYSYASSFPLAPVSTALSYNDGGIGLARSAWPLIWFKGGSEQGVLTLGYLARRADGTLAVVVLQLSDPSQPIAADVTLKALVDVGAAFKLVASSTSAS